MIDEAGGRIMATTSQLGVSTPLVEETSTVPRAWHPLTLVAFRATFTYFLLTIWLWIDELAVRPTWLMRKIYPVFANHLESIVARYLLHSTQIYKPNSFRDTHYLYLVLLGCVLLTVLITAIWSVIDRKRTEYSKLYRLLRIFLRYSLAYVILLYGMDKVVKLQFPAPSLSRLIETYGNSSPMALMWTFMGYSTAYTIFSGMAEVMSGILLLFRRTTLLGALLCGAVMLNVTIMDFSYDVSVKMCALNLLLIAVVLILPDAQRMANMFVFNRPVPAAQVEPLPRDPGRRRAYLVVKTLVVIYLLVPLTLRNLKTYREVGPDAPKAPLYGLYQVDEFRTNGEPVPASLDAPSRWRYIAIESKETLYVKHMDDSLTKYSLHYDPKTHVAAISTTDPVASSGSFTAEKSPDGKLQLSGALGGQPVEVRSEAVNPQAFLLNSRGFHWISETSFFK